MKYKVTHTTKYSYSEPVGVCHNRVMLTPQSGPRLRVLSHRLVVRPTPQITSRRTDFFGNSVQTFSIEENHRQITITATSRIAVEPFPALDPETTPPWEAVTQSLTDRSDPLWLDVCVYQFDSPRIARSTTFADYARLSFELGRPVLAAALDFTRRINTDFRYDTEATTVTTSTEEAFAMRHGVCQDFAHVQIACLRSLGVPARYVSGYLRTLPPPGKPRPLPEFVLSPSTGIEPQTPVGRHPADKPPGRLVGADESHAWVAVYCGEQVGWVDLDPTNDCVCSLDHVPVAVGRDYTDVTPIKGVFLGGGSHTLKVSVDVAPEET